MFKNLILMLLSDKLREHILRIHANNNSSKNRKKCQVNIKDETLEPVRRTVSTEMLNQPADDQPSDETLPSTEEKKDCAPYSDTKHIQSDDELPDIDSKEASGKPRFKPKVPPTDFERFIYKCQYCMLGFKRRGEGKFIKFYHFQ